MSGSDTPGLLAARAAGQDRWRYSDRDGQEHDVYVTRVRRRWEIRDETPDAASARIVDQLPDAEDAHDLAHALAADYAACEQRRHAAARATRPLTEPEST